MSPDQILPFQNEYRSQIINLWEKSVLQTHSFLSAEHFEEIKLIVHGIDFNQISVFVLMVHNDIAGFLGVEDRKIEMLFIHPDYFGEGLGRSLVEFAVREFGANEVEVNEQNTGAVIFYKKLGFTVYDRSEMDHSGLPYPILKMRL